MTAFPARTGFVVRREKPHLGRLSLIDTIEGMRYRTATLGRAEPKDCATDSRG